MYSIIVQRCRDVSQNQPEREMVTDMALPQPEQGQQQSVLAEAEEATWQAELVARSLAGDEKAFELITEQYGALLLRTAYLLVQDEETAKDIVQDSLLLAWKNLGNLREPTALRAWLLKIVMNQAMSLKRTWARKTALLKEHLFQRSIEESIMSSDFQRGKVEEELDLAAAINRLPLKQRAVLVLVYYHRMTMPEISKLLGVGENTLRKRLQAAIRKVRVALDVDDTHAASNAENPPQDSSQPGPRVVSKSISANISTYKKGTGVTHG